MKLGQALASSNYLGSMPKKQGISIKNIVPILRPTVQRGGNGHSSTRHVTLSFTSTKGK